MERQNKTIRLVSVLRCLLLGTSLVLLCGFAGYTEVTHHKASPKGTYNVKVTLQAGPSARYSKWLMDVARQDAPFLSDYKIRPFYALSCVEHGKVRWLSDSVLHLYSYGSGQGRVFSTTVSNATDKAIPLAEVWIRSVDPNGYSHCPGICFFFDTPAGERRRINPGPLAYAGGEYFLVGCEQNQDKFAVARFKVPKPVSAHAPYIPFRAHHVNINLTDDGPVIECGGGLESITEQEAKALVHEEVGLPLVETRRRGGKEGAGK